MPTYDYRCDACGQRLEVLHGVHGHGPRVCPSCGAEGTMRKLIAAPAVHFKGSGWAKKDRSATAVPGTSQAQQAGSDQGTAKEPDAGKEPGAGKEPAGKEPPAGKGSSQAGTPAKAAAAEAAPGGSTTH